MHLILIGMPGAGKTTLVKKIAQQLGWPYIDTDWEVQKRAGMSIADLIAAESEAAFRTLETEVLADALAESPSVIATGGGAPIQPGAMDKLKAAGLVVYLPVQQEVAVGRILADTEERLHLAGDTAAKWAALLEKREAIYQQAHIVCQDTDKLLAFVQAHAPAMPETAPTFRG